jgi:hypothetical protein
LPPDPPDDGDGPTETRPVVIGPPTAEHEPVDPIDDLSIEEGGDKSGSIDVAMSDSGLPQYRGPDRRQVQKPYPGPDRRGKRPTVQRAAEKVEDVVSSGVGKVGAGMDKLGAGVRRLGARVDKLPGGHRSKLGTGMIELGAGISEVGASLTELPKVARTRRGRVLVRSLIVGFFLVFTWIAVIIYFQLRGGEAPDLRPRAEEILIEIRDAKYQDLYAAASPRFQEISDAETFQRTMEDMRRTLGPFKEIAAVNDTVLSRGPGGLVARVDCQIDFEKARAHATISLHRHNGVWKFLGIGVDLPDDLIATETSPEARATRVKAPPEVRAAAEAILEQSRDNHSDAIWDNATPFFQQAVTRADFIRIEDERRQALGRYVRIVDETKAEADPTAGSAAPPPTRPQSATSPGGTGAWLVALVQYENAIVSTTFVFEWDKPGAQWKLWSYVVVLPMPRAPRLPGSMSDAAPAPAPAPTPAFDAAP